METQYKAAAESPGVVKQYYEITEPKDHHDQLVSPLF